MNANLLSDGQKADRAGQALLLATLTAREKRKWVNVWTGDESQII
jgi:hypothetical protein